MSATALQNQRTMSHTGGYKCLILHVFHKYHTAHENVVLSTPRHYRKHENFNITNLYGMLFIRKMVGR